MNKRTCINLHYRISREIKVMERMHIEHNNIESQVGWVEKWSPKERTYTCGGCPSVGLCKYMARYRTGDKTNG